MEPNSRSDLSPPRWAEKFLRWYCSEELLEEIQGDLQEAYHFRLERKGPIRANLAYIRDVIQFFKPYSFEQHSRSKQFLPMFNNYLKIAVRNILKTKVFTAFNMLSLSVGISAVLIVSLYLRHELTYDRSHPDSDKIFRLVNHHRDQMYTCMSFINWYQTDAKAQFQLIDKLKEYPETIDACHFVPSNSAIGGDGQFYTYVGDRRFILENFLFTNSGAHFKPFFHRNIWPERLNMLLINFKGSC